MLPGRQLQNQIEQFFIMACMALPPRLLDCVIDTGRVNQPTVSIARIAERHHEFGPRRSERLNLNFLFLLRHAEMVPRLPAQEREHDFSVNARRYPSCQSCNTPATTIGERPPASIITSGCAFSQQLIRGLLRSSMLLIPKVGLEGWLRDYPVCTLSTDDALTSHAVTTGQMQTPTDGQLFNFDNLPKRPPAKSTIYGLFRLACFVPLPTYPIQGWFDIALPLGFLRLVIQGAKNVRREGIFNKAKKQRKAVLDILT